MNFAEEWQKASTIKQFTATVMHLLCGSFSSVLNQTFGNKTKPD